MIDEFTKAAIIGYYRSGATIEQIIGLTWLDYWQIKDVIDSYKFFTDKTVLYQ